MGVRNPPIRHWGLRSQEAFERRRSRTRRTSSESEQCWRLPSRFTSGRLYAERLSHAQLFVGINGASYRSATSQIFSRFERPSGPSASRTTVKSPPFEY